MITQKTWTDLLGKPQGNEMVWASEIIREVGLHRFTTLWTFDNNTQAVNCFEEWLKENNRE
jgi:hypothetical protein